MGNKIDSTAQATQALQMQMMMQIMKNSMGDSNEFQLVMESLSKAMSESGGDPNLLGLGIGNEDLSKLGYGQGQNLDPMLKEFKTNIETGNLSIDEAIEKASQKYGVDKDFIKAVIQQESSFDPKSTSNAGAMGLMQLMPGTAREMGVTDPYDIGQNIDGGTRYLKMMLDINKNNKELALAAYNAGPGAVQNRGVSSRADYGKLPYETQDYIKKVMKYYGK